MAINITYEVRAEQDDIEVRGNALASGDAELDRKTEDEIIARLDRGDIWAWAHVTVFAKATVDGEEFIGRDDLGGCCYKDEKDFTSEDGYYPDMKQRAREDLVESVKAAVKRGDVAKRFLKDLES